MKPDESMSGYQLMIAGDVFRGRYLKSFEKPEPLHANAINHYQIAFPANDHTFQERPPDHGPGAEHLVSGDRSKSANSLFRTFSWRKSLIFSRQRRKYFAPAGTRHISRCRSKPRVNQNNEAEKHSTP